MSDSRSLDIFYSTLKTDSTKKNYRYWLDRYLEWTKKPSHDQLLNDKPETIQTSIENYIMELRRMRTTKTVVKITIFSLLHFFAMNRVILNEKIIKKLIPEQEGKVGGKAYSTQDVKKIISAIDQTKIKKHRKWHYRKPRAKAIVHMMASSGIRLGALNELKLGHLTKIENCYAMRIYADTKSEYTTFLTPEATKALDEYLATRQNLTPESWLINMQYEAIRVLLYRLVKKAKVSQVIPQTFRGKFERNRLDIPTVHGLRKRFNTIMKSNNAINKSMIEMMMGHNITIQLDESYMKPTTEKLFSEYKKGIADLTIFSNH